DGTTIDLPGEATRPDGFTDSNRYRYTLPSTVTLLPGAYQIEFLTGTFKDTSGGLNDSELETFTLGSPAAALAGPSEGGQVDVDGLNTSGYIAVRFRPVGAEELDVDTILDSTAELTLSGAGASGVVIGAAYKSDDDDEFTYRYPFTGKFTPGAVSVAFAAGAFADTSGELSGATTGTFTVTGAKADQLEPLVDVNDLNNRHYIDVRFTPAGKSTSMNASSITDSTAEFTLSGTAATGVTVNGAPVLQADGKTYRYSFTGLFKPGVVTVSFAAGAFADSAGVLNVAEIETLTILGSTASFESFTAGENVSLSSLNALGHIDVRYLPAHGGTLDPSSITDNDPEFTLSGEGAAGVTLGASTKVDSDTFRYSFTGAFSAGRVEFLFADAAFKDTSNNTNVGKTDFIQLTDLSADLANPLNGTAVST
ncbi:MAG TPA: hypothetical protein PLV92_25960, partial [Pirellulaceae bacterium]|nr:hypothetical protein [Pirellulaceae bacterium]